MEGEVVTMQEIFKFQRISTDADGNVIGQFVSTGIRPKFIDDFEAQGIFVSADIFDPNRVWGQNEPSN